ncbi:hypothetical protein ACKWTF_008429 [Chironomus riparius]
MKFEKNTAVCNLEWKIRNFTEENYERSMNKNLNTNFYFIMLGKKMTSWKLHYGFDREGIVIDLKKMSRDNDFKVKFTGFIDTKKSDSSVVYFDTYEEHANFLYKKHPIYFTELEHIFENPADYLENGVLTINLRIELFDGFCKEYENCNASDPRLSSEFTEMFQWGLFSDFTIICSDKTVIRTHRLILSENSPVFKVMLQCPMKESISGVMEVNDIDGPTMNDILLFMYDSYHYRGWGNDLKAIFCAADKYQMNKLKDKCVNQIVSSLNVEDVLEFFMLADFYNHNYLMQRCIMFIKAY